MALVVFLISLIIFLSMGVPVFIAIGACAIVLMMFLDFTDPMILALRMIGGVNNFVLIAVPFFILAGEIMTKGGLGKRLVLAADVMIGRFKGGLGYTNTLQSVMFSGLSGSALADVAMSGSLLYPLMKEKGYKPERAMGAICASSMIALLIPPSTTMILLGTTVGLSIPRLFMAGIFPGLMLGLVLLMAWFFIARIDGYTDTVKYTFRVGGKMLFQSIPALVMPVIIIVGIRFGVVTPTEAGALAVIYALLVCAFVYRDLTFRLLWDCMVSATKSIGMVMSIIATASIVGWLITIAEIPRIAINIFEPLIDSPQILLLVITVFLILVGLVMDLVPTVMIFAPMLFPVAMAAGIDPIYFGILMVFNVGLAMWTPPIGTVLFMAIGVSGIKYPTMVKGVLPFLLIEYGLLFSFIFFPSLIMVPLGWLT